MPQVRLAKEAIAAFNERLIEHLLDDSLRKEAISQINDYTRTINREGDAIPDAVIPLQAVTKADLDPVVETDNPSIIIEKQPGVPAAVTMPFLTWPHVDFYLLPDRYRVTFGRVSSARAYKDVIQLMTYRMDLREVISDIMRKEINMLRSRVFLGAVNAAMVGADQPVPWNGNVAQWRTYSGGISRNTMAEILKITQQGPSRLPTTTYLLNATTHIEFLKWDRLEWGGDLAEEVALNGFAKTKLNGRDLLITIQDDIVPDGTVFMFCDPKHIGKNFVLQDITMFAEVKDNILNWYFAGVYGGAIGHTGGLARADIAL